MKAYRLEGSGEDGRASAGAQLTLVGREVAVPQPGRGDVLVRVQAVGVCHRELVELKGGHPAPFALPLIAGHEVSPNPGCWRTLPLRQLLLCSLQELWNDWGRIARMARRGQHGYVHRR